MEGKDLVTSDQAKKLLGTYVTKTAQITNGGAPSADGVGQGHSVVVATPDPEQYGGDEEGADTGDCASSTSALDESDGDMEAARSAAHAGTLGSPN